LVAMPRALITEPARPRVIREHPWAPWLAVLIVCFGAFMGQLDASIVTLAFPALQRTFGAGLAGVQWVSLVYLLVVIALLIPVGRWSDRHGRKLVYLYGFAIFSLASAGCGFAPSLQVLIGFRVVQAVGAAMLQANSIALVSTSVAAEMRRKALGLQAVAQAAGLALGPVAGGLLVSAAGWRWVFLINPPVGLAAIAAGIYLLPRTRHRAARGGSDPAGVVLLATVVAGALVALSAASGLPLSPAVIAGIAAVTVTAAGALAWQQRRASQPLIDRALLAAPGARRGLAGALGAYLVLFGPLVLYPQLFTAHHRGITASTGLVMTALPAGFAAGALLAERLLPPRWGDRLRCLLGGTIAVAGTGLLAAGGAEPVRTAALLAVLGIGLGIYMPANNSQIMSALPAASAATAGGMVSMARGAGTALGVALVALCLHAAPGPDAGGRLAMIALGLCAAAVTLGSVADPCTGMAGRPKLMAVIRSRNPAGGSLGQDETPRGSNSGQ
jgi:MFS family permease